MGAYAGPANAWSNFTNQNRIDASTKVVVQSGLVLNLDAGASTSYPGSGTTWTDLSGSGNNGTLTNGPTFNSANGGSIVFDGVNDRIECGTFSVPFLTVSTWVYKTTSATNQGICRKQNGWAVSQYNGTLQVAPGTSWTFYNTGYTIPLNTWVNIVYTYSGTGAAGSQTVYINGSNIYSTSAGSGAISSNGNSVRIGFDDNNWWWNGRIAQVSIYNRALTAAEILQNYNALKGRFIYFTPEYETLTYTASGNLTVTGTGTDTVNIFRTSGGSAWGDSQAYSTTPFTAPCTIEFNKQAASGDNSVSYAMIGWNSDPLTNASYDSLDYASYPYRTDNYQVYHNGSLVQNGGTWSTANKFYIVYGTDGTIKHYNGSTLLYSVNYGTGNTVYVDSSFYSVNATFGGFSNIKVRRSTWNGTAYVG
jgi:hypothetical protein